MRCRQVSTKPSAAATAVSSSGPPASLSETYRAGGSAAARAARTQRRCRGLPRDPRTRDVRSRRRGVRADPARPAGVGAGVGARSRRRSRHRRLGGGRCLARNRDGLARRGWSRRWCAPGRCSPNVGRRALREARWTCVRRRRRRSAGGSRARLLRDRRARSGGAPGLRRRTPGRSPKTRSSIVEPGTTAGYERMLAVRRRRDRSRRLDARAMPSRRPLPAHGGRLVPLRDPPGPEPARTGSRRARSAASRTRSSPTPSSAARATRVAAARDHPPPRPPAGSRRARPLHGLGARAAHGLEARRGRVPARRASSAGATRSENTPSALGWAPCSASPSSPGHRPESARRPRAPSQPGAGTASSSRGGRTCCARSPTRSAARWRCATSATATPSRRSRHACSTGIRPSTLLVNNAGMPARGTFLQADLDLIERVTRVNYLGGVWCTRAFMPGLEAAARDRRRAHREHGLRRGHGLVRAGRRLRGLQARPARVLALACGGPARQRDRGPLDPARLRRDRGLPAEERAQEPAHAAASWSSPSEVADAVVKAIEQGQGGDRGPVVPVPARRDRPGHRAGRRRPLRRHVRLPQRDRSERLRAVMPKPQPGGEAETSPARTLS